MQSKEYQKIHMARCLSILKTVREKVMQSIGARMDGSSHTEVNATGDIKRIAELLIKDLAMVQCIGRYQCGPRGSQVAVQEATDGFDAGIDEIMKGQTLRAVLENRQMHDNIAGAEYDVPEAVYHDFDSYWKGEDNMDMDRWIDEEELATRRQGLKVMHTRKTVDNRPDDLAKRDWRVA
jgi:hypothetical protein